MANGDVKHITSWDSQATGLLSFYELSVTGGSYAHDSGQSVPDGSAQAMKLLHNASGALTLEKELDPSGGLAAYNKGCISFWFKGTTTGSPEDLANAYRGANSARNWYLRMDSSGNLTLAFWNTNKVSATLATIDSGWHYLQVAWDYSTTTNKLTLAVDGVQYTEQTYTAAASPALDYFIIGNDMSASNSATSTRYYGPIVFTEGYYIPPRIKVKMLRPTSDVDSNWTCSTGTSRYALVDDTPPDSSTYISTTTASQAQTFGLTDITLASGESVKAVQPYNFSYAGSGTQPYAYGYLRYNSTNSTDSTTSGGASTGTLWREVVHLTAPGGGAFTESIINAMQYRLIASGSLVGTTATADIVILVAIFEPVQKALTAALSFTSAQVRGLKKTLTAALSFTSAQSRIAGAIIDKALTATLSFTGTLTKTALYRQALTATLSFTGNGAQYMWRQLQDAGGWFIKKGRIRRRRPY